MVTFIQLNPLHKMMKNVDLSMMEAAKELGITRRKLFSILREKNILVGTFVNDSLKPKGYFNEYTLIVRRWYMQKPVNFIKVTPKGLRWLKELIIKLNQDELQGK